MPRACPKAGSWQLREWDSQALLKLSSKSSPNKEAYKPKIYNYLVQVLLFPDEFSKFVKCLEYLYILCLIGYKQTIAEFAIASLISYEIQKGQRRIFGFYPS